MPSVFLRLITLLFTLLLAACNQSSPSDAPANVVVSPGDSQVVITWDQKPDLQYYVFVAAANSITTGDFSSGKTALPQSRIITPATSPFIISGLTNGTTYSFVLNATQNGGPAGPASASIAAVPRLAGTSWAAGKSLGAFRLNSTNYGFSNYVSVGTGGSILTSVDGSNWVVQKSGSTADLNAVVYNGSGVKLAAVGNGGVILNSTDAITWTASTSNTAANLYGVTVSGTQYVAVGAAGVILTSTDGVNWSNQTSGTTKDLYAVAYLYNGYYAVGAAGTMLYSVDGVNWVKLTSPTSNDLYGVAYAFTPNRFVAVGAKGTLLNSGDGVNWVSATPFTSNNLYSVVGATQFVAVGSAGAINYSQDGLTWTSAVSNTSSELRNVFFGVGQYLAVGVNGSNVLSK